MFLFPHSWGGVSAGQLPAVSKRKNKNLDLYKKSRETKRAKSIPCQGVSAGSKAQSDSTLAHTIATDSTAVSSRQHFPIPYQSELPSEASSCLGTT